MLLKKYICAVSVFIVIIFSLPDVTMALLNDKKQGKWSLIGKAKTQATFRTIDTPDNNQIPIEGGEMISQRNLLMLEFRHDLGELFFGIRSEYYLQGRAFYDGAWDYGPDVFSDAETRRKYVLDNEHEINELEDDIELFMGYIDLTSGPLFARVGRQVISWGEMSTKRILDGINPLDTSSLAVDLLERLVPLDMLRINLLAENVGPFSSLGIDFYYVPGHLEDTIGEDIIDGSPVQPPIGRDLVEYLDDPYSLTSLKQVMTIFDDDIDSDRYGFKFGMMIGDLELNYVNYRTYSDIPVPRINIEKFEDVYLDVLTLLPLLTSGGSMIEAMLDGQKLEVVLETERIDVSGLSFNYYFAPFDMVIRGEAALYEDVPKITPGNVWDLIEGVAPKVHIDFMGDMYDLAEFLEHPLIGPIIQDALGDVRTMELPFTVGDIARYDVLKYGIGFDKNVSCFLNPSAEFMLTFEYVGSKIRDYDERTIIYPWQGENGETLYEPEYTHDFIMLVRTTYFDRQLTPQLVVMYEGKPNALIFIPSLALTMGQWDFECSFFYTASDSYEQEGFLESRDEFSVSMTYNF